MEKIKYVHRQDSGFKLSAGNSGETSLNLSNEIFDLITKGSMRLGEESNVTFKLYKEDCIKAVCFIILKLPLYQSSSNASTRVVDNLIVFQNLIGKINYFFGENEIVDYTVNLYYRTDGRIYLNRLKVDGFSIRDVLVENNSALLFKEESNGKIALRILSDIKDGEIVDVVEQEIQPSLPLQQIFYGAPGTGKSHKVNKEIQNTPNALVFRTTFHPDSDYSTFVGAYKPTMKRADRLYSADELIDKLSEIKTLGHTYPCHKFAAKYWYSLKGLSAADIKRIVVACDFPESMTVEVGKGIAIGEEMAKHVQNDKIVYSFVPQAFLKAYVAAWQNPEQPVFLVIEEINRGNCAQIFGDIFQLLDRKDGVSEYPIKADQDIRDYLAKEFAGYDLEANILSGEELVLPANLHIWATMNTSDQSLFPIDSAFKRRWDWKYMPIHDAGENWTIALSDVEYDWWDFVEKINNVIGNMTSSEDKKLGYFFCKACNGKIDAETFVNKVVFYLWNDVFKDYELSDKVFQDGEGKLTFNKFYTPSGDANESTIKTLMENMGVSTSDLITEIDEEAVNLSKDDLSALQQKRLDFWTRYLKYAQNNAGYMQYFGGRQTPTKNYYCQFHVLQKKGYLCVVIKHKANKLFVKYETMDEQLYNTLYSHKAAIESELGDINLTWEGKVGTRERIDIYAEHNVDFNNEQSIFNLIIDRLLRMREVFDKYLNN